MFLVGVLSLVAADQPVIALTASGGVGLTATVGASGAMLGRIIGASGPGCPSVLDPLTGGYSEGVGVVATNAPGDDGLRYFWDQSINPFNGWVEMFALGAGDDGGLATTFLPTSLYAPGTMSVASSFDRATAFAAINSYEAFPDGGEGYDLHLWSTAADLSGVGNGMLLTTDDFGWWAINPTQDHRMATGYVPYEFAAPARVVFTTDDSIATLQGTWDAVCGVAPSRSSGATVSVASYGTKLGVLVTLRGGANLSVCDLPPPQ
jgi:hypothetical protein